MVSPSGTGYSIVAVLMIGGSYAFVLAIAYFLIKAAVKTAVIEALEVTGIALKVKVK